MAVNLTELNYIASQSTVKRENENVMKLKDIIRIQEIISFLIVPSPSLICRLLCMDTFTYIVRI